MNWEIIGFIAAALTSFGSVPQVIKSYRTKEMEDVAFWMVTIIFTGVVFWLIYGIAVRNWPLIFANIFAVACYGSLVGMKVVYKK